jgi:uncharacterized membrane protein YidH (DUF202 family)
VATSREAEIHVVQDRQVMEILQELRVAITGAQLLFGFLLTVPFSQRWGDTTDLQRTLFAVVLIATAAATALFIAPAATHRLRFHQRDRAFIVSYANTVAIAGMGLLLVAIACAVALVCDVVFGHLAAALAGGLIGLLLVVTWVVIPLSRARLRE